jgi:hypothetical protein
MATTITWVISALNCIPQTPEGADYVVTAHWSCNGADGTYNGSVYSTCSFPVVQGSSFVPYEDLTEDDVLGWCWANGVDKDATEAAVQTQIDNQIDPPIVTPPLPWAAPVTA